MHVLCVDDDRINALLLEQTLLLIPGVSVSCAESGAEALAQAQLRRPDWLIIDLHLPDTNGLALLPRLQAAVSGGTVPAFLCTAELPADVADEARTAGYRQTWGKPVSLAQLQAVVDEQGAI
jgi:CheY-like chemotaxis protein